MPEFELRDPQTVTGRAHSKIAQVSNELPGTHVQGAMQIKQVGEPQTVIFGAYMYLCGSEFVGKQEHTKIALLPVQLRFIRVRLAESQVTAAAHSSTPTTRISELTWTKVGTPRSLDSWSKLPSSRASVGTNHKLVTLRVSQNAFVFGEAVG